MPKNRLLNIVDIILDETSSRVRQHQALDDFAQLCDDMTGIQAEPTFDAWAEDTFLEHGVAINSQAAAQCIKDYQRSIVFIRGVYAALTSLKPEISTQTPIRILYAGCGPFATLLLPVLVKFEPTDLDVRLLDIHQISLDSVHDLIANFELEAYQIETILADACTYRSPEKRHLIIAETMQKSLEQEPQFAVTANLSPQLEPGGVFIPEKIEVSLCLAKLKNEQQTFNRLHHLDSESLLANKQRVLLGTLLRLEPERAAEQLDSAAYNHESSKLELAAVSIHIPELAALQNFDALLLTHIQVFGQHQLSDYECDLTLPQKCLGVLPLIANSHYAVRYQLGQYPKFDFKRLESKYYDH